MCSYMVLLTVVTLVETNDPEAFASALALHPELADSPRRRPN